MIERAIEQLLSQPPVADLVGMGKAVPGGRRRAAQRRQRPAMQAQSVANIVEAQTVGELRKHQRDDVAPGTEVSRLLVHAGLTRELGNQVRRNQIANLLEDGEFRTRWLGVGFVFHTCPMAGSNLIRPAFFSSLWDACGIETTGLASSMLKGLVHFLEF